VLLGRAAGELLRAEREGRMLRARVKLVRLLDREISRDTLCAPLAA